MNRRQFLRGALMTVGAAGALGSGAVLLSGCSDDDAGRDAGHTTLAVAALGNAADKLDPTLATGAATYMALYNIWDSVALLIGDEVVLQLAESVEPNSDGTQWTVRLRDGVKFSDGSPVTAADVVASLAYFAGSRTFAQFYSDFDAVGSKAVDDRTALLQLRRARGDFVEATLAVMSVVLPGGKADASVGSGPFRLESGDGAQGYVLTRSEHYYGPAPELERIEIRPIADATARQNALTGGQVMLALDLDATSAQTLGGNSELEVQRVGGGSAKAFSFVMNTRMAPFDDAEVRKAMRLAIDREQLREVVMRGQGTVGNDLLGIGLPGYDTSIEQRTRDVAAAREVFVRKNLKTLSLKASDTTTGLVNAAELVVTQLREAGVIVTVDKVDPAAFYSDPRALFASPFLTSYYVNRPVAASLPFQVGSSSPYNFSGYDSPALSAALAAGAREVDPTHRAAHYNRAQQLLSEDGGEVIWGFQDALFGKRKGLEISQVTQSVPLFATARFR